jgi:hypothetical protein
MSSSDQKESKKKPNRWLIGLIIVLVLLIIGFTGREKVQKGITAWVIYRKHVFIPPPKNTGESSIKQFGNNARFYWDIAELRLARDKRVRQFNPTLKPLVSEIVRHQKAGEVMQYSMNIYREIRWRLNFTTDTVATRLKINELRESLSQPSLQKSGLLQQSSDGSWGAGISVWYLRLYYSVDDVVDSLQSKYPYSFLDPINSPEKLRKQLESDLYDDFTRTGIFNREELDETFSGITRLLKKKKKIAYPFHPQLDSTLIDFVKRWQNPETGCWGQWLIDRDRKVWKMDDMGITFHVISDLHGQVAHKDLIAKRLLELENVEFPTGIRFDGDYTNHLNWDAVKIFRFAWPYLDTATRDNVRGSISRMLHWCLTKSYQPDGSFKISELDDTMGDAYSYGVEFLNETGYFQSKDRFWTDQNFPEAKTVHDRIKAKIISIGLNDPGLKDAYETLNGESF